MSLNRAPEAEESAFNKFRVLTRMLLRVPHEELEAEPKVKKDEQTIDDVG